MTSDETLLAVLRHIGDLRVPNREQWAKTHGRTVEEIEALIARVEGERAR